jgi:hypothetical protein
MRPLLGRPVRGIWQLRVVDTFRLDEGRLNRWRIAARVAGSPAPLSPEVAGSRPAARERGSRKASRSYAMA